MTEAVNKPNSLPKNWKVTTFGEMAKFLNGYAFAPDDWKKDGLPIIRIEQLRDENAPADYHDEPLPERFRIQNGDLIFSWSASLLTRIWDRGEAYLNQHLFKVENRPNINRAYLKHLLDFNIDAMASETHGSTMKHITRPALLKYPVKIPVIPAEQRAIADILTTVDDAIEQTEALIHKYQRIKQGLMQDLFTKGINPRRSLTSTELGTIPDEWKISQIKKITNVRRGASPRPIDDPRYFNDTGRGWVRISDVTSTYKYLRTTSQYLSNLGSSLSVKVNPGDLIMSICASIGKPIILDMPACIHDGFVLFQDIHPDFDPEFLFYFLDYRSEFIRGMNQTGTQGNLNTGIVKSIFVPQPRLEEQKEIISVLSSIDKSIENETQERNKLVRIKQGLMQDLLTGKVRVNTLLKNRLRG